MIRADTNLGEALSRYVDVIRFEIQSQKSAARPTDSGPALLFTEDQILCRAVERAEEGQEFQHLVRETALLYNPNGVTRGLSKIGKQVAEFFRLSGVYCDLFDGQRIQSDELLPRVRSAFETRTQTITHYAPIEWVYFSKGAIRFGEFEIRQLTATEIETVFRDRICRVFHPWARLKAAELSGYWFLIAEETVPVDPRGETIIHFSFRVDPHRPRFSSPIDRALSLMALADWGTRCPAPAGRAQTKATLDTSEWPLPGLVPFVVSVSDYLLDWPRRAPDTSLLNRIQATELQTDEVCDRPNFQIHWDIPRAEQFERLLATACLNLERIQPHENQWAFVQVALGFLGRAFISEGIESLLWNMTAIDSMLGKDERNIKARLSDRVGKILGKIWQEKCKDLYGIRSDLVHGNAKFTSKVHLGHLGTAREMARLTALWLLHYLACVTDVVQQSGTPVPSREDLLAILAGDAAARQRHTSVTSALPTDRSRM